MPKKMSRRLFPFFLFFCLSAAAAFDVIALGAMSCALRKVAGPVTVA